MLVAIAAAGAGNVSSQGMQTVGSREAYDPGSLWRFFSGAVLNPWVVGGILLELANYFLWLAVLSWSDVSWALPLNALEYILVGLAAAFFLGEAVGPVRWLGIALIAAGVALLMGSWEHPRFLPRPDRRGRRLPHRLLAHRQRAGALLSLLAEAVLGGLLRSPPSSSRAASGLAFNLLVSGPLARLSTAASGWRPPSERQRCWPRPGPRPMVSRRGGGGLGRRQHRSGHVRQPPRHPGLGARVASADAQPPPPLLRAELRRAAVLRGRRVAAGWGCRDDAGAGRLSLSCSWPPRRAALGGGAAPVSAGGPGRRALGGGRRHRPLRARRGDDVDVAGGAPDRTRGPARQGRGGLERLLPLPGPGAGRDCGFGAERVRPRLGAGGPRHGGCGRGARRAGRDVGLSAGGVLLRPGVSPRDGPPLGRERGDRARRPGLRLRRDGRRHRGRAPADGLDRRGRLADGGGALPPSSSSPPSRSGCKETPGRRAGESPSRLKPWRRFWAWRLSWAQRM